VAKEPNVAGAGRRAFRTGPPVERTPLRDNLEYFAALIVIVLVLRQVVVEAFRIEHGSMAPTLVGVHKELRCPNCDWVLLVGRDKEGERGEVECPNCHHVWPGASTYEHGGELAFRRPAWLWNTAYARDGSVVTGTDAANRVSRGAGRIFVNKFIYSLRKPRRWEVVVFLFPDYYVRCKDCDWQGRVESLDGLLCPHCGGDRLDVTTKNFIKRVAGMPGETIELKDGDVYADGVLVRKPPRTQKALWMHVFDSRFMPNRPVAPVWDLGETPHAWRPGDGGAALTVDARGSPGEAWAAFAPRIMDFYAYDGLSYDASPSALGAAGRYEVGDVRIRARVRVLDHGADGAVLLGIEDAGRAFNLALSIGGRGGATLRDGGDVLLERPSKPLGTRKRTWVVLENYDDRIVATVGGRTVLSFDYAGAQEGPHRLTFGAREAHVAWERIIIERDVYYCDLGVMSEGSGVYELGEDEYFVLGDNSPASSDSRRWRHAGVPARNLIGRAFFVFWPVHHMKGL